MPVVAVMITCCPEELTWLGAEPIVSRIWKQLNEIRGIDRRLCVAATPVSSIQPLLSGDVEICPFRLPKAATDEAILQEVLRAIDPVLGPETKSDPTVIAVVRSSTPLIPVGIVDLCIEAVARRRKRLAATVLSPAASFTGSAPVGYKAPVVPVVGVQVFLRAAGPTALRVVDPAVVPVVISKMAALDICDPDDRVVLEALEASGRLGGA